jgi:hypothetical protein
MKRCSLVLAAGLALSAPACTPAAKIDHNTAYENCKGYPAGPRRTQCIEEERMRLAEERADADSRCLEEINRQDDRRAMRKGWRTGDPQTEAADFDACASY